MTTVTDYVTGAHADSDEGLAARIDSLYGAWADAFAVGDPDEPEYRAGLETLIAERDRRQTAAA